jgi:hypothetical protein
MSFLWNAIEVSFRADKGFAYVEGRARLYTQPVPLPSPKHVVSGTQRQLANPLIGCSAGHHATGLAAAHTKPLFPMPDQHNASLPLQAAAIVNLVRRGS